MRGEIIIIIILGMLLLLWGVLHLGVLEAREWENYALKHDCVESGYTTGSMGTGVAPVIGGTGGVGVVSVYTPGKTRYVCDNNVEIYR